MKITTKQLKSLINEWIADGDTPSAHGRGRDESELQASYRVWSDRFEPLRAKLLDNVNLDQDQEAWMVVDKMIEELQRFQKDVEVYTPGRVGFRHRV